jgi:hypothetical protein
VPTFGFSQEGTKRIVDAVRRMERQTFGSVGGSGPPGAGDYPTPMHIGKLSSPLTSTGSATVTLWGATQASTGDEASLGTTGTVYQWGSVNLSSGDEVKVWRHNGSGRLYADGIGRAQFIEFTLTATLSTTDDTATVTRTGYWHGSDPGANPTVKNPPASTDHVFSAPNGYSGGAVWDDLFGTYRIIWVQESRSTDSVVNYSTVLGSTDQWQVVFYSTGGKLGAVLPSTVVINWLNSSNVVGFSTAVTEQYLRRTSTGLHWFTPSTCV